MATNEHFCCISKEKNVLWKKSHGDVYKILCVQFELQIFRSVGAKAVKCMSALGALWLSSRSRARHAMSTTSNTYCIWANFSAQCFLKQSAFSLMESLSLLLYLSYLSYFKLKFSSSRLHFFPFCYLLESCMPNFD